MKNHFSLSFIYDSVFALLALTMLIVGPCQGVITGEMTAQPAVVESTSTIAFEVQITQQIPADGTMVLIFNTGFNLGISNQITCSNVYALDSLSGCTVDSNSQLTLTNAQSFDYLVIFSVNNIVLPDYVSSFFVQVTSYGADGSQLEKSGSIAFTITTLPSQLTVQLQPASSVVGEITDLAISLQSQIEIDSSGWVEIDMPKWNAGTQQMSLAVPFFQTNTLGVISANTYSLPCSSPDHPSLLCQFQVNLPSTSADISQTYDVLKIQQFASDFKSLTVTTGSLFKNPPSTKIINTFSAASFKSSGLLTAQQIKISLKVTDPAILDASAVDLVVQDGSINMQTAYQFTVNTPLPGPVGLRVEIKIPSQLSLNALDDPSTVVLTSAAGFPPVAEIPYITVLDQTSQLIQLSLLVPNSAYYVDEGNYVRFDLFDIVNAPSIQQSDSFEIYFYEFDDIIMQVTQGVQITAQPGTLTNVQVQPEGYRVRDLVPYAFAFVTENRVFQNSLINIVIPKEITVDGGDLTVLPVTNVNENSDLAISYDADSHTVQLSNVFDQDFNTPQLIEFIINTGLKNAESTEPISQFIIETFDSSQATIDTGVSRNLTYTPNEISSIVAQACADKDTASETEDVCTYKLTFYMGDQQSQSKYPIMSGSQIEIDLPDDLSLFSAAQTAGQSSTQGIADLSATFTVGENQKTVTVNNAFIASSAPNGQNYQPDSFSVSIAGVVSPRTTAPTLSFKARIRSSEGYLQYVRLQGVYSNVYQARPFQLSVIKRSNETNGDDSGIYNFTLQFSSQVNRNEYVKITPPPSVLIHPGGVGQCQGTRMLATQLACSILDGELYVLIDPEDSSVQYFSPGDIVMFQVSDIRNPLSLEPTVSFGVYIATSTSQDYYINQMVQGLSILNTYQGQLSDVRVLPDTNQFNTVTDYSIYFVTTNFIDKYSYLVITFPPESYSFTGQTIDCNQIKNIEASLVCTVTTSNVITITKGYELSSVPGGTEIGLKLNQITNPTTSVSVEEVNQDFSIETVSVDDYGIDRSYYLDFSIGCSYPCESCDNLQTICTSCQTLNDGTPLYLYESQCNVNCPISTYASANNTCLQCDPLCKSCSDNPNKCDSCREDMGFPYVTADGVCTAKCTDGTFLDESSKTCEDCEGNCFTCNSAINCLSCKPGYFYIEGQCLSTCPSNSIQFDSVEVQECLKCEDPCASCEDTVTKCTSCSPSTYLYGTTCVDKCPPTYLPDQKNVCYEAAQPTVPFITLIVPLSIIIVILVSYFGYTKDTAPYITFLALESCWMVLFWIYMLGFLIADGHHASATLVSVAIFANFVINYLWWEFYNDKLINNDVAFQQYGVKYPRMTKAIKIIQLVLCFDFFRISYSHLFDTPSLKADMLKKDKNYKRINRYELFQITFCYLLTLVAAAFNLFYTWYGRQIFWIDIEALVMGTIVTVYKLVIIFKSEKHYIKELLDLDGGKTQDIDFQDANNRKAIQIGNNVDQRGLENSKTELMKLSLQQRAIAMRAIFYKLFTGQKLGSMNQKQINEQLAKDRYLFKHGAQLDFKHKNLTPTLMKDDPLQNGNAVGKKGGQSEYAEVTQTLNANTTEMGMNEALQTMQLKQDTDFGDETYRDDCVMYNEKEMVNFHSCPMNADSALFNNSDLQERHQKFQEEMKNRNDPLYNKKALKMKNLKNLDLDDDKSKQNKSNKTLASRVLQDMPGDSDDEIEDFTSEKWGPGASKVVADHYNNIQRIKTPQQGPRDRADLARPQKLTQAQFQEKIEEVKTCQLQKRLAKEKANEYEESANKLDKQLTSQQSENKKLRDFIKSLEMQIAQEQGRLSGVRQTQKTEEFAENAFYTSNEDGMGLSPNQYDSQNRPRRATSKPHGASQIKAEQPVNQEQIALEEQILKQGRDDVVKSGAQSITAEEIKAIQKKNDRSFGSESSHSLNDGRGKQETDGANVMTSSAGEKISNKLADSKRRKMKGVSLKRQKSSVEPESQKRDLNNLASTSSRERQREKSSNSLRKKKTNMNQDSLSDTNRQNIRSNQGKVTKKGNKSKRSLSGIKQEESFGSRALQHRPLNKESGDRYEYYTSEDEFGLPVNKLRKKTGGTVDEEGEENDLEFYSTVDKNGQKVQRLRKKGGKSNRSFSQNTQLRNGAKNKLNFQPGMRDIDQSTIKGTEMNATGDNFGKLSEANSQRGLPPHDALPKGRSRSNNAPGQLQARQGSAEIQSQMTTLRNTTNQDPIKSQQPALRNAGMDMIKSSGGQGKPKRPKKVSAPIRDFSGPYFKHTNFEKAVIATKGKAPYNNKEVEIITKRDKFDPSEFQFMNRGNNWVNQTQTDSVGGIVGTGVVSGAGAQIVRNSKSISTASPRQRQRAADQSNDMGTASVTATTVFQGLNPNNQSNMLGASTYQPGSQIDLTDRQEHPSASINLKNQDLPQLESQTPQHGQQ